jgi:hypothetical protein
MSVEQETKRKAGLSKGEHWLVLTESTWSDKKEAWTHTCGHDIEVLYVSHSIHDGPFPLSGSGKTAREKAPYCPQCETK